MHLLLSAYNEYPGITKEFTGPKHFVITRVSCISNYVDSNQFFKLPHKTKNPDFSITDCTYLYTSIAPPEISLGFSL